MKLNSTVLIVFIIFMTACSSGERIITDDGKIYTVKGSKIKADGIDVTETLTEEEKNKIEDLVDSKVQEREAAEDRQDELEEKKEAQEKIEEEAEKCQEEIEKKQEELEKKRERKQEIREAYVEAKRRLEDKKDKYENLKEKGKLSPRDEAKWQKKIEKLEKEVKETKDELDKIK
jgi:chromosome segregation ATPase